MNVKVKSSCPWDMAICENADDAKKIINLLKSEQKKECSSLYITEVKFSDAIPNCVKADIADPTSAFVEFLTDNGFTVERI